MPELPEIYNLAAQMDKELRGHKIAAVEVRQEKCLNIPEAEFRQLVEGKTVGSVTWRGKWLFTALDPQTMLLISLGMGGELLLHQPGEPLPDKYQLRFDFADDARVSVHFWWFGYAHAVKADDLKSHGMTMDLGLCPLRGEEFTYEHFAKLLAGRKGGIKAFLMDQKNVAGIGNVYIQDILFRAGLHPRRKIDTIGEADRRRLFDSIRENLRAAADLGGLAYERDLYNREGRFRDFLVGYREGQACPACGAKIVKIKTGSTASFICPVCQS